MEAYNCKGFIVKLLHCVVCQCIASWILMTLLFTYQFAIYTVYCMLWVVCDFVKNQQILIPLAFSDQFICFLELWVIAWCGAGEVYSVTSLVWCYYGSQRRVSQTNYFGDGKTYYWARLHELCFEYHLMKWHVLLHVATAGEPLQLLQINLVCGIALLHMGGQWLGWVNDTSIVIIRDQLHLQ